MSLTPYRLSQSVQQPWEAPLTRKLAFAETKFFA